MLEICRDILECESTLQQHLPSVKLLGQLPLTDSDLERIFVYIHQNLAGMANEDLSDVIERTPAVLACYLVWKGIWDYDEGTYWKSLSSELGPLDTNLQVKIGKFFRKFLETHNLFLVEIPDSQKYITPILLHGIIPRTQIAQFFEQVVYPLVRKELVDPVSEDELAFWFESKREVAKRAEQLEILQNKLKRVERAEKSMTEWNSSLLEQEILQIEEQICREEANLTDLQAEFNSIRYDPTPLTGIEDDLEKIKRLEDEYELGTHEIASQMDALNEKCQGLQRYSSLGIDDPHSPHDYEAFRCAAYTAIINAVATALGNSEEHFSTEAYILLEVLYDSVSDGSLSIPADLVEQIEDLHQTYGTSRNGAELKSDDERLISGVEEALDILEPETECITESHLTLPCKGATQVSDNSTDPDITLAHVLASEDPARDLEEGPSNDLFAEDGGPLLVSRYAELSSVYLPGDTFEVSGSGADARNAEARVSDIPEASSVSPGVDSVSEQEDVSSCLLPRTDGLTPPPETSPEKLVPLKEDPLPPAPPNTRAETASGDISDSPVNGPCGAHGESEREPPAGQEIPHDFPEELEARTPLEPKMPIKEAEDALQPISGTSGDTLITGTVKSRSSSSPQKGKNSSRTSNILSTLANAIIGVLSFFFRKPGIK